MHWRLPRTSTALGARGGQHCGVLHILKASPWCHWHALISAVGPLPLWYEDYYGHAQHILCMCDCICCMQQYVHLYYSSLYVQYMSVHTYYNMCVCMYVPCISNAAPRTDRPLYMYCIHLFVCITTVHYTWTSADTHIYCTLFNCTLYVCICTAYSDEKPPHNRKVSNVAFKMARAMSKVSQPTHWTPSLSDLPRHPTLCHSIM